jgi:hypothetical protein
MTRLVVSGAPVFGSVDDVQARPRRAAAHRLPAAEQFRDAFRPAVMVDIAVRPTYDDVPVRRFGSTAGGVG